MSKVSFGNRQSGAVATGTTKPGLASKKTPDPAKPGLAKKSAAKPVDASVAGTEAPTPPKKGLEKAKPKTTALAKPSHNPPTTALVQPASGFEGEIGASDLKLPRINLVQAVSALHKEDGVDIGSVVFDKEVVLIDQSGSLEFVVLFGKKRYQQKLPKSRRGEQPEVVDTLEEVRGLGGTDVWSQEAIEDARYFEPLAHLVLAVKAPDDLDPDFLHKFPLVHNNASWARVAFTVAGSSYKSFAKAIITQACSGLRDGLYLGLWKLKVEERVNKTKDTWVVPTSSYAGRFSEEGDIAFFAELASRDVPAVEDHGADEA